MPICEMCGNEEQLYKTSIEGSELNVCKQCSKYGKVIKKIQEPKKVEKPKEKKTIQKEEPEITQIINPEFSQLIKKKRESLNLSQKEFAKKINEKESLIHNIESNRFEPNIKLAKKIEKFLKIKLIEEYKEETQKLMKGKSETLTIGDFIKVKK